MKALRRFARRLHGALFRSGRESDMAAELESHIELQTEDNIRAGMSPDDARREAALKFGAVEAIKESHREQRGIPLLETTAADLRFAFRSFRKSPVFTITAVAALALGIGATTAIF